ncbi:unnamed protein product [Staurois parvus]|uniref:Uncharacterized protein n=1 Tax=Staurois parvus TaxID=386267 RepID=A0ABN9GN09_9NEOB|nr:unnamed protein product [Staurois parvus]
MNTGWDKPNLVTRDTSADTAHQANTQTHTSHYSLLPSKTHNRMMGCTTWQ